MYRGHDDRRVHEGRVTLVHEERSLLGFGLLVLTVEESFLGPVFLILTIEGSL